MDDNEIMHAINNNLSRLADAVEEILRLVKKDMEPRTKKEKNMEKTITKYEEKERHNAKQGKADA